MKTEKEKIIKLLNRTYDKGAWHGSSVKEILQEVNPQSSLKKLPNSHSIIELVAHMTAWRKFVILKLQGDTDFVMKDEMNFPAVNDWNKVCSELDKSQQDLIQAIEKFPEEKLSDLVPTNTHRYTFYTMLHGIIHHDLYHLGQISLINKQQ